MNKILIVFCFVVSPFLLFGQSAAMHGKVLDEVSGVPIEFATISIFDDKGKLVGGGISELGGEFTLESTPSQSYAIIEFLSYEPLRVDLSYENGLLELGQIMLKSNSIQLDGVEVVAQKSTSQYLLDKKVFNVGSDIATRGGSAQDILNNVPSVTVDIEGNIALRGSNNVRILINGKPSGLLGISGNNGLRNLQASQIERIEVITNPSARYDAEGTAGIINIVLKKDITKGFSGSFQATTGLPFNLGGGANLNYRKGGVNFFVNYGINMANRPGSGRNYTEFYGDNDSTFVTSLNRNMDRFGNNQNIRAGLDFYLKGNQSVTASFGYNTEDNDNETTLTYRDQYFSGRNIDRSLVEALDVYTKRTDNERELEDKLEYALDYRKEFSKDHTFAANLQYQSNGETEKSVFNNSIFDQEQVVSSLLDQRSSNAEREKQWLIQADYINPITKKQKLEFGTRASIRRISNEYLVETLLENDWTNEVGLSNDFNYDEDVYAAYAIYNDKRTKWSYQLGVRSEYSDIKTLLLNTNEGYDTTYINLFPSAFVSYELTQSDQIQLSYSRRINRPRFRSLNPFFTFSDNRNFFSGNPFLRPEYTDSYELGYLKFWENSNLSSSLFFRRTNDNTIRFKEVDVTTGTSNTKPINLGLNDEIGVEFQYSIDVTKWLKVNSELNLFHSRFFGDALPEEFRTEAFVATGRLDTRVQMLDGTDLQVRTNYRGAQVTPQGRRRPITSIDIGISRDFMNKNLTATINVRDLLNQRKWNYERYDTDFYEDGEFQWMRNSINLTISYRINAKKERPGRDGHGGGGDGGDF